MGTLHRLRSELLCDGKITSAEVGVIRRYLEEDGTLDHDDVRLLVTLLSEAREVCEEFDELFFPVLKKVLLEDGQIGPDEQYYLLKMLYADGRVRPSERKLLEELLRELTVVPPEFVALCNTAFSAKNENWEVGGVETPSRRPR